MESDQEDTQRPPLAFKSTSNRCRCRWTWTCTYTTHMQQIQKCLGWYEGRNKCSELQKLKEKLSGGKKKSLGNACSVFQNCFIVALCDHINVYYFKCYFPIWQWKVRPTLKRCWLSSSGFPKLLGVKYSAVVQTVAPLHLSLLHMTKGWLTNVLHIFRV